MATSANPRASPLGEAIAEGSIEDGEVELPEDSDTSGKDHSSKGLVNSGKEKAGEEHDAQTSTIQGTQPPLPTEAPPGAAEDDGWAPVWDDNARAYYFYNRLTSATQWENPRVAATPSEPPGLGNRSGEPNGAPGTDPSSSSRPTREGYNPAIHGDYDPTASYAQEPVETDSQPPGDPSTGYSATGAFNRFTGRWQASDINPELHNDESKSKRQMGAYFDVDAAANSHHGKSLKAERSGKKLSKQELRAFKEKRKEKKEEKRRAWLRD